MSHKLPDIDTAVRPCGVRPYRPGPFVYLLAVVAVLAAGCRHPTARLLQPLHRSIAEYHAERGERHLSDGDLARAAADFERALTHCPNDALTHARLGRVHADAGDDARAIRHYRAAVKRAPESPGYALALADCLRRRAATSMDRERILEAAARAYRHAHWLDPWDFESALGLARAYRQLGAFDRAIAALRDAEAIDPSAAVVQTERAAVYLALGEYRRATSAGRRALKLDPDNLAAHNTLGQINTILSRLSKSRYSLSLERAMAHFRRSLQIRPDQPRIRDMLTDLHPPAATVATLIEDADE